MRISGPLHHWREEVGRRFLNLDFKPESEEAFRLSLDLLLHAPGLAVGRTRHTAGHTFRDREMANSDCESVSLLICRSGHLQVSQGSWDCELGPSGAAMVRNYEPGRVQSLASCDYFGIVIDESQFRAHGVDIGTMIGSNWQRSREALHLLGSYVRSLNRAPPATPDVSAAASRHIVELIALATRPTVEPHSAESGSLRDVRLAGVRDYLASHFRDPGLSLSAVAQALNISPRYVQLLMEEASQSFTGQINEMRLQLAYRHLTDPDMRERSVTDIAMLCGFSDVSHFNRLFRRRFDATPSAIRARLSDE